MSCPCQNNVFSYSTKCALLLVTFLLSTCCIVERAKGGNEKRIHLWNVYPESSWSTTKYCKTGKTHALLKLRVLLVGTILLIYYKQDSLFLDVFDVFHSIYSSWSLRLFRLDVKKTNQAFSKFLMACLIVRLTTSSRKDLSPNIYCNTNVKAWVLVVYASKFLPKVLQGLQLNTKPIIASKIQNFQIF